MVDIFDVARAFNTILEAWGEPRTYGVTLSLNWGVGTGPNRWPLDPAEFRRALFEERLHALSVVRAGEAGPDRVFDEPGVAQPG